MNSRTLGLRLASAIFSIVCLGQIALLCSSMRISIGDHHLGRDPGVFVVIISGLLCIWMAKLAGPWCGASVGDGARRKNAFLEVKLRRE